MKYAVVDLEMCKVPKIYKSSYNCNQETIQIGAVMLDEDYNIIDSFNTYVKPQYGQVDPFIQNLTGISQKDLIGAPSFEEALGAFLDWLTADDVRCVSWSGSDPGQLIHEYKEKGLYDDRFDIVIANWKDCQKTFSRLMGKNRAYSLEEALIAADISQEGKAHDGFDDARNTALLFAKMEQNEKLKLNPIYEAARDEEVEHLGFSMGDLLAGIVIA
jgi:inhibitor of KinA sporulation pathway (predicted exonuclease)